MALYNEVDASLRSKGFYFSDIELAFGWLVEKGRIRLVDILGTNAWVTHCGQAPLPPDKPIMRIGFGDIPIFESILNAYRNAQAATQSLTKAKRKDYEAKRALQAAYDSVRLSAQAPAPVSAPALG